MCNYVTTRTLICYYYYRPTPGKLSRIPHFSQGFQIILLDSLVQLYSIYNNVHSISAKYPHKITLHHVTL